VSWPRLLRQAFGLAHLDLLGRRCRCRLRLEFPLPLVCRSGDGD
jgi:hypothetical protein